jgi:hypothetical protein
VDVDVLGRTTSRGMRNLVGLAGNWDKRRLHDEEVVYRGACARRKEPRLVMGLFCWTSIRDYYQEEAAFLGVVLITLGSDGFFFRNDFLFF